MHHNVQLGQFPLHSPCHACAFFHDSDEEYELLLPFCQEGYEAGDKLFQVVDRDNRSDRLGRLAAVGIDVDLAEKKGQLEVRAWEDAYLRDNHFNQHRMLELIQNVLRDGRARGFPMTRLWANMEWALEDLPGVHDLVEYETRLNEVLPKYDDVVVCTYDLNRFSAPVVMDIMRTHPHVIIGGIVQENPFYLAPSQFLEELKRR
jgi:MEDS: MEthanogen/methylotroph, DcmR Sensory domain